MPRHPPIALTTLNRSHCQCSSSIGFGIPILLACARRGSKPDHTDKPHTQTQKPGYLLQPGSFDNAIDVFDKSALLELRRAAHLQLVLRPASRDQIRYRAVRQRQSDHSSEATRSRQQQTIQSDRLSYLHPAPRSFPVG